MRRAHASIGTGPFVFLARAGEYVGTRAARSAAPALGIHALADAARLGGRRDSRQSAPQGAEHERVAPRRTRDCLTDPHAVRQILTQLGLPNGAA